MTVCTQQFDVVPVRFPIAEATRPNVMPVLRPQFFGRVDVVDVQRAKIVEPTLTAFPAKFRDQRQFAIPIATALVRFVSLSVPVIALAGRRAESRMCRRATFYANTIVAPSCRQIARLAAIFTRAVFQAVRVHLCGLAAVSAGYRHPLGAFLSHRKNITHLSEPRYFDIACERIRKAYDQPDMFIERPKPAKQEALL